jgi:hypothetical protein
MGEAPPVAAVVAAGAGESDPRVFRHGSVRLARRGVVEPSSLQTSSTLRFWKPFALKLVFLETKFIKPANLSGTTRLVARNVEIT